MMKWPKACSSVWMVTRPTTAHATEFTLQCPSFEASDSRTRYQYPGSAMHGCEHCIVFRNGKEQIWVSFFKGLLVRVTLALFFSLREDLQSIISSCHLPVDTFGIMFS